jgi:hypothetical protein
MTMGRAETNQAHSLLGHGPRSVTDGYGQVSVGEMLKGVEVLVG